MSKAMSQVVDKNIRDLTLHELKDLRIQGLFISNSLIKSIRRQVFYDNHNPTHPDWHLLAFTGNSVHEGFRREMTSFAFSEDITLSVSDINQSISDDPQFALAKGALFL